MFMQGLRKGCTFMNTSSCEVFLPLPSSACHIIEHNLDRPLQPPTSPNISDVERGPL